MGLRIKIKSASPRTINSWLLFIVLIFFVAVFFLYWFIYVKNSETVQVSNRFRVLTKMGDNVFHQLTTANRIVEGVIKSAANSMLQEDTVSDTPGNYLNYYREKIENSPILDLAAAEKVNHDEVFVHSTLINIPGESGDYAIISDKTQLFGSQERKDLFDFFLIMKMENTPGSDEGDKQTPVIIYNTSPEHLDLIDFNALKNTSAPIEAGTLVTVEISKRRFRLFLKPIGYFKGEKWYIGGFIDTSTFNHQVRALPSDIVVYLLIGFLIFLFAIPILKLFLMSSFDQLTIADVILTSLSMVLCVILLLLLNINIYVDQDDVRRSERNLKALASNIQNEFHNELEHIHATLTAFSKGDYIYDIPKPANGEIVYNIFNFPEISDPHPISAPAAKNLIPAESRTKGTVDPIKLKERLNEYSKKYPFYKLVFWMDRQGNQIAAVSTRNSGGKLDNLGYRDYFKDAGGWNLDQSREKKFMLESITSISSGEKLAAVSMKSSTTINDGTYTGKRSDVIAMTTRLYSVIDTILPVGYGFCIIDGSGQTWFHSDSNKNQRENFIKETDNQAALRMVINKRETSHLTLTYQNKTHRCFILPMANFPLYLITFHDTTQTDKVRGLIIWKTVSKITALLLFNIILFAAAGALNYRHSLLKSRYIPFDFLRPLPEPNGKMTYSHLMTAISTIILLIAGIMWYYGKRFDSTGGLYLYLSACLFIFILNYLTLNKAAGNSLCCKPAKFILFTLVVLILIHLTSGYHIGFQNKGPLFMAQLAMAVIVCLFYLSRPKEKPAKRHEKIIKRPYYWFLFSWLTLTCIIPPILFFNYSFNQEQHLFIHNAQVQPLGLKQKRDLDIDRFFKEHIYDIGVNSRDVGELEESLKNRGIYARLTNPDKPPPENVESKSGISLTFRSFFILLGDLDSAIFPLAMIVILSTAYFFIGYIARNVFGLRLLEKEYYDPLSTESTHSPDTVKQAVQQYIRSGAHVIILCQTGEHYETCRKLPPGDELKETLPVIEASFPSWFQDVDKKESQKGILRIVDMDTSLSEIGDNASFNPNRTALQQLLKLMKSPYFQVIIITQTPAGELIQLYKDKAARMDKDDDNHDIVSQIAALLEEINTFLSPVYVPMERFLVEKNMGAGYNDLIPEIKEFLFEEFKPSVYFDSIQSDVLEYCRKLNLTESSPALTNEELERVKELLILEIQRLSGRYYSNLLNGCDRKERFVLFDIAQDRLLNINNKETIAKLIKKGLLRKNGSIDIMNASFKNFILTTSMENKAKLASSDLEVKGRWKSFRAPISLLVLGAAVFLAFQKDLLNDIQSFSTAIVGGIAILTKFSGVFSKLPFISED